MNATILAIIRVDNASTARTSQFPASPDTSNKSDEGLPPSLHYSPANRVVAFSTRWFQCLCKYNKKTCGWKAVGERFRILSRIQFLEILKQE